MKQTTSATYQSTPNSINIKSGRMIITIENDLEDIQN